jgi:nitrite reductase/ring-hydroxylating ferredoxin subunit
LVFETCFNIAPRQEDPTRPQEVAEMSKRYPLPPFPNGWFQVAYSDELELGQVVPLRYFGKRLVMFRAEDGTPTAFDAYCPHMGADLGVGGRLEGGTLVCPFHAWRFDGRGHCVDIPYANKVPAKAQLNPWPVCERNGLIMVWHHAQGKPPEWEIPEVPEYGSDAWTDYERRRWKIRVHNQDMAENAVDRAHFEYVHGTMNVPESKVEADGPVLHAVSKAKMHTPQGDIDGTIDSTLSGFGFSTIRFGGIVDTLLLSSVTPIDGEYVDVRFSFSVKKLGDASATRGVGAALIQDIEKQMSEDIPIWENKGYIPRPILCDGDGPIGVFRRWCRQFYSDYEDRGGEYQPGEAY